MSQIEISCIGSDAVFTNTPNIFLGLPFSFPECPVAETFRWWRFQIPEDKGISPN